MHSDHNRHHERPRADIKSRDYDLDDNERIPNVKAWEDHLRKYPNGTKSKSSKAKNSQPNRERTSSM